MKKENSRSSEKRKTEFVDDGRTVYDMSGLDDMHRTGPRREKKESISVTRKERRALIRAPFLARNAYTLFLFTARTGAVHVVKRKRV